MLKVTPSHAFANKLIAQRRAHALAHGEELRLAGAPCGSLLLSRHPVNERARAVRPTNELRCTARGTRIEDVTRMVRV